MRQRNNGCLVFWGLMIVSVAFGAAVWANAQPAVPLRPVMPTVAQPTDPAQAWQEVQRVLSSGFDVNGTPIPTIAIPDQAYVPPTIAVNADSAGVPVEAARVGGGQEVAFVAGATPTLPPPTPTIPPAQDAVAVIEVERDQSRPTNLPPLIPPISLDPLGRDHYWFTRPIDSFGTNYGLGYYLYGTDGPDGNPYPIHHGIDMSNPTGKAVRAAGAGIVTFATSAETPVCDNSASYGRCIKIEHDFGGPNGEPIYTLYAHLEEVLVKAGDRVEIGDTIALLGGTGRTTGSHVHFEVRMGEDRYGSTYNPLLWMVPYVGHGTIAGRVVDDYGNPLEDVDVTVMKNGRTLGLPTTTYIILEGGSQVNPDPRWQENFVFPDVAEGRYEVVATINGNRISEFVDVSEGMTSFVEIKSSGFVATESQENVVANQNGDQFGGEPTFEPQP